MTSATPKRIRCAIYTACRMTRGSNKTSTFQRGLRNPRSLFPGNRILRSETEGAKMAVSIERRLAEKATAANEATRLCTRSSIQMRAFAIARTKGIPAAFQACLCLVSPVGRAGIVSSPSS